MCIEIKSIINSFVNNKPLLEFTSTLIWQSMLVIGVITFRNQLKTLIARIVSLKFGNTEVMLQKEDSDSKKVPAKVEEKIKKIEIDMFLTESEIDELLIESEIIKQDEKVEEHLLLFKTQKQKTWLIISDKQIICVLDDKNTRMTGTLVQWNMPLSEASPIKTRSHKENVGLIDIGKRRSWLFSKSIHPVPVKLEKEIKRIRNKYIHQ